MTQRKIAVKINVHAGCDRTHLKLVLAGGRKRTEDRGAYSGAKRTRNPIDVGQCSDSSRTAFRFLSDSVPIQFGQCSGLRPDSFWATLEWCPKRSERCPREPGRVSERGRNRGAGVVERRWVNCQGSRSIRCESGKAPNGTKQIIHASNSRDPTA